MEGVTGGIEGWAQTPEGLRTRVVGRHSPMDQVLDPAHNERLELLVQVALGVGGCPKGQPEQATDAGTKAREHGAYFAVLAERILPRASK